MWPDTPEQRFEYIAQRHAELRAEAAANRACRKRAGSGTYRIRGLHFQVGTLLIVVGRRLCDEDRHLLDAAH
ncbi:MAG: hypothetical protein ABSE70_02060 [Candidatus Limnocylindrales bacterium]